MAGGLEVSRGLIGSHAWKSFHDIVAQGQRKGAASLGGGGLVMVFKEGSMWPGDALRRLAWRCLAEWV